MVSEFNGIHRLELSYRFVSNCTQGICKRRSCVCSCMLSPTFIIFETLTLLQLQTVKSEAVCSRVYKIIGM